MLEQFGCVAPVLVHEEKLQGLLLADHLAVREYEGPPQPRNMPTISLLSILTVRPGHGNNMQHSIFSWKGGSSTVTIFLLQLLEVSDEHPTSQRGIENC